MMQRSIMVLVMLSSAGCGSGKSTETSMVDSDSYDFGTIVAISPDEPSDVKCQFRITNTTDKPMAISRVDTSCACTAADTIVLPFSIEPGKSVDLPVRYRQLNKVGQFQENILVRFAPETIDPKRFKIAGFVWRGPQPIETKLVLSASPGEEGSRRTEIRYVRPKGEKASEIGEIKIEGDGESALCFVVSPWARETNALEGGGNIDVWGLRVGYRDPGKGPLRKAVLRIRWRRPEGAVSTIELFGKRLDPIEMVGDDRVVLPDLGLGVSYREEFPIRINDFAEAEQVGVELVGGDSSIVQVSCKLDLPAKRLILSVKCVAAGSYRLLVRLKRGDEVVGSLEIVGVGKELPKAKNR